MNKAEIINIGGELKERACDSLVMCIVTTLNQGLRNGGGIGDILRAPSSIVSKTKNILKIIINLFYKKLCYILGTFVCCKSRIRFTLLLHRDNYCFESHLRCDY